MTPSLGAFPDGRQYIGKGIVPDIIVYQTIESIRSGRDAVLERAIRYLTSNDLIMRLGPEKGGHDKGAPILIPVFALFAKV